MCHRLLGVALRVVCCSLGVYLLDDDSRVLCLVTWCVAYRSFTTSSTALCGVCVSLHETPSLYTFDEVGPEHR